MLALVLACSIGAGGVRAQSNDEYQFNIQQVDDGTSYGTIIGSNDPVPILTMDCLAANGYGQWTLSTIVGAGTVGSLSGSSMYPAGWYLLENALRKPSLTFNSYPNEPGCIPPGVVQNGSFTATPNGPKNTANLDGWVNYIWPTSGGSSFEIQDFSSSDIDLSGSFCTNPTINKMNVITANSINANSISVSSEAVVTESDFRDEFDVASDAHFLYIVWASGTSPKQIWAMAVPLGSSTPAIGPLVVGVGKFPTVTCVERDNRGSGPYTAMFDVAYIGPGNQPADVSYTNSTPTFFFIGGFIAPYSYYDCDACSDLSTITTATHVRAVISQIAGQTSVYHGMYVIGFASLASAILPYGSWPGTEEGLFLYPQLNSISPTSAYVCDAPMIRGTYPSIIASTNGIIDEPITAFCNPYDNQNGYGYEGFHCVYREHITDVEDVNHNPLVVMQAWYNGTTYPATTTETRLVLMLQSPLGVPFWLGDPDAFVDGNPVLYVAAVNQMGIHIHWHAQDLTPGGNPSFQAHYYARDMTRTFDEPIEENTLVTDLCNVTDGYNAPNNHGGTVGAELLPGKNMLVWTDPNYGASTSNTNSGLYQPVDPTVWWTTAVPPVSPPVGTLQLGTADGNTSVKLTIGDVSIPAPGAKLTVMPNFYILFPGRSQSTAQTPSYDLSLIVNGGSTLNYYGAWGRNFAGGNPSGNPTFGATQITESRGDRSGEGLIDLEGTTENPANLIVHGGADFHIGEDAYFLSNHGLITIEMEPNIFPLLASGSTPTPCSTGNTCVSGIMTFEGQATINNSTVKSHMGAYPNTTPPTPRKPFAIIRVPGSYDGGDDGPSGEERPSSAYARDHAFSSSNTIYSNLDASGNISGLAIILFDQLPLTDGANLTFGLLNSNISGYDGYPTNSYFPYPYKDVSSTGDFFNNVEILAMNPQNTDGVSSTATNFNITGGTFSGTPIKSIDIQNDQTYVPSFTYTFPANIYEPFFWWGNILISGNTFHATGDGGSGSTGTFIHAGGLQMSEDNTDSLFQINRFIEHVLICIWLGFGAVEQHLVRTIRRVNWA